MAGGRGDGAGGRERIADTRRRVTEALDWFVFTLLVLTLPWGAGVFDGGWFEEPWQGTLFWLGLLLVFPVMGAYYVWRTARLGVTLDDDAVVVRNREATTRLAVADIERFDLAGVPYDRHTYVTAVLRDGSTVPIDGLRAERTRRARARQRRHARAQTFADQLNDALIARRHTTATS
jgi:hypothetical protein